MKENIINKGKTKTIYKTNNPEEVIIYFDDTITAFNKKKEEIFENKGQINKSISTILFKKLSEKNIRNHYIKDITDKEFLAKKLTMIPIEIVIRNIAAGSLVKRLGIQENTIIKDSISEFFYKKDELDDPLINENHISFLNLASKEDLQIMLIMSHKINSYLKEIFDKINLILVDFKLEFGKDNNGEIYLGDEITPDSCRIWDKNTKTIMDKDIFRKDLGHPVESYQKILDRLNTI